jgi:hypothetical protein
VSKGGRIDFDCLTNIIGTMYNRNLTYIFSEFIKHNTILLKDSKDIVQNEQINKDKPNISKKIKKDISFEDSEDSEDNKELDIVHNSGSDDELSDESIDSIKSAKSSRSIKNKSPVKNTKKKNNDVNDINDVNTNTSQITNVTNVSNNTNFVKIVSKIPTDFSLTGSVFTKISPALKKILKISPKNNTINYIDFRKLMLDHLKKNDLIINNKITLKVPFLYDGKDTVVFNEINEWIYSLLASTQNSLNTKTTKIVKSNKIIKDDSEDDIHQIATVHDVNADDDADITKDRKTRRALASKGQNIKSGVVKKNTINNQSDNTNVLIDLTTKKSLSTGGSKVAPIRASKTGDVIVKKNNTSKVVKKPTKNTLTKQATISESKSDTDSEDISTVSVKTTKKIVPKKVAPLKGKSNCVESESEQVIRKSNSIIRGKVMPVPKTTTKNAVNKFAKRYSKSYESEESDESEEALVDSDNSSGSSSESHNQKPISKKVVTLKSKNNEMNKHTKKK